MTRNHVGSARAGSNPADHDSLSFLSFCFLSQKYHLISSAEMKMTERLQQWSGRAMSRFSFKNATIIVCLLNLITALFLIHGFLSHSTSNRPDSVLLKYIKESEELRLAMEPVELIKRVREIEREAHEEVESVQEKDSKQSAALDLISRLNNHRSYSDADNQKALEEWRKRKMERARQRGLGRNGTVVSQE